MADKPKDKPFKPKEGVKITGSELSDSYAVEQTAFLLGGLFLLGIISMVVMNFLNNLGVGETGGTLTSYFLENIWPVWKMLAVIVIVIAPVGIVYNLMKIEALSKEEKQIFNPSPEVDKQ